MLSDGGSSGRPHTPPPGAGGDAAGAGISEMMSKLGKNPAGGQKNPAAAQQKPARPLVSVQQEVKNIGGDVVTGVRDFIPDYIQSLFHLKSTDTPEEKAKKQASFNRFKSLSEEQQQWAIKKFNEDQKAEQQKQQEEAQKQQLDQQKKAQESRPAPKGKRTGMMGGDVGKSKSDNFMDDFNQKRKMPSSAG